MAAPSAVLANSTISLACFLEYPCAIRSASEYAPDNWVNVSVNTSEVSHSPFVNDSLKEPYFYDI